MTEPLLIVPLSKAWSDEARQAAAEARAKTPEDKHAALMNVAAHQRQPRELNMGNRLDASQVSASTMTNYLKMAGLGQYRVKQPYSGAKEHYLSEHDENGKMLWRSYVGDRGVFPGEVAQSIAKHEKLDQTHPDLYNNLNQSLKDRGFS